ncbi:hypothetical protein IV102_16100 [bacterium]|nr:hypothetical protein [bacterium]
MTPTPDRQEIDDLKASIDLVALFESYDVPVTKVDRSIKALCPFHTETTPSMGINRKKGVYQCCVCLDGQCRLG